MRTTYDEVDREARADRRNADIPRDRPDLDHSPLSPVQFGYEPPRPVFDTPAEPDPF